MDRDNVVGRKFANLTILADTETRGGNRFVMCKCDCGNTKEIRLDRIKSGRTRSCGCLRPRLKPTGDNGQAVPKIVHGTNISLINNNRLIATNKSGVKGVSWYTPTRRWQATISFKNKQYHLGRYHDIEDAIAARVKAEEHLHGKFIEWYNEEYGIKNQKTDSCDGHSYKDYTMEDVESLHKKTGWDIKDCKRAFEHAAEYEGVTPEGYLKAVTFPVLTPGLPFIERCIKFSKQSTTTYPKGIGACENKSVE